MGDKGRTEAPNPVLNKSYIINGVIYCCPACRGAGQGMYGICAVCNGSGYDPQVYKN